MRRRMMLKSRTGVSPVLPAAYQQVEYIESSGTQAIKTDKWLKQDTEIYCEFMYVTPVPYAGSYLSTFGCSSPTCGFSNQGDTTITVYCSYGSVSDKTFSVPTTKYFYDDFHTCLINSAGCTIDSVYGVSYSGTVASENQASKIALFARSNQNGTLERFSNRKIRAFQIRESGVLVTNLIPCYRKSDDVIGMYDTVNDIFYTNAGTGVFTKGGNV